MIQDYVATGKVKFEFRDMAFIGAESTAAAEATDCAMDQGKFWPMHNTIYANQHQENSGEFSTARLEQMAQLIGLNTGTFNSCLTSGKHAKDVQDSVNAGQTAGVSSTPTITVNGQVVTGGDSYATLKPAIDKALGQ